MVKNFRPAVMWVFVNNEWKVLIWSSPRDWWYKFPQWWIDNWESSIDAIKREMNEELWIILKEDIIQERWTVRYNYPDMHGNSFYQWQGQTVFHIDYTLLDHNFEVQDEEFHEMIWVHPENLCNFDTRHRYDAYYQALKLCNLLS